MKLTTCFLGAILSTALPIGATLVVQPDEDVMTSAFFFGPDFVRGYRGDNRSTFRVSSNNAFGAGPETIYLDFSSLSVAQVESGILTLQSVSGGFGADASSMNPFVVSAHAVDFNPFTAITDNRNPGGSVSWETFFNGHILPSNSTARTTVSGFGTVTFDVTFSEAVDNVNADDFEISGDVQPIPLAADRGAGRNLPPGDGGLAVLLPA